MRKVMATLALLAAGLIVLGLSIPRAEPPRASAGLDEVDRATLDAWLAEIVEAHEAEVARHARVEDTLAERRADEATAAAE